MSKKVFISHSSKDRLFVRRLVHDLQDRDIPVWYDEFELRVGDSLRQKIGQGIEESGWLLVVLSNHSVQSPWVQQELNAAFVLEMSRRDVFILPAVIDDCKIPPFLNDKVYADFRSSYENGLAALLDRFGYDAATLFRRNIMHRIGGIEVTLNSISETLQRPFIVFSRRGLTKAAIVRARRSFKLGKSRFSPVSEA